MTELIAARPQVPGFGDQLDARQRRILQQCIEETCARIEAVLLAAKRHAEIEAEAIDMIFLDPVVQRIERQLDHALVGEVDGVAAAGVIDTVARIVRLQAVVD
jgi:hypothetical protein